ncbi:hypothetical protein [Jiella avicenniae]|uniref:Uncharacterized protein n=1 Tax=Jiella avicenniae TaxID=2907202 RepID=A0A9X1T4E8_9HYPH|nr:hypothetical protein [Jiella avicenniae]MCE7028481.1 hypothetical protein [Jiella avicenniae]
MAVRNGRVVSLNARTALEQQVSPDTPITLITIRHLELDGPLRLSTDPTVRTSTDPLTYGTWSRMLSPAITSDVFNLATAAQFDFVLMSAVLPEDREDGTSPVDMVIENVASGMTAMARKLKTPAQVDFAVVLAATPDYVDFAWTGLYTVGSDWDDRAITIPVSREVIQRLSYPFGRMTRSFFPGLF